jgi:asparagine synthase (glutamine-hydrolysing)
MCGICGFTGTEDISLIKAMTQLLEHRGPDDEGYYNDGLINCGFRRLSIIDLGNGHQPMANRAGDVVVCLTSAPMGPNSCIC